MTALARWWAALVPLFFVESLLAQPPRFFNQAGCVGAGSMFSPAGSLPWTMPRLFPSIGGGFYGPGPIISIGITPPIYPSPILAPPYLISPPIEPIELVPPSIVPVNGPSIRGEPAGRFRPVGPLDRDRARMAAPPAARAPIPPENPMAENARLVREAKRAFAEGEFGRAAELLQKATVAAPNLAGAHFLLAQAWIALGKYVDASVAIHRGIRLQPDWPDIGPPTIAIYGNRRVDFDLHRQLLTNAGANAPTDATLQFLNAYVAWFDDREDEARRIFASLRSLVADPAVIDLFLAEP
jgi:hypothetical protein